LVKFDERKNFMNSTHSKKLMMLICGQQKKHFEGKNYCVTGKAWHTLL